MNTSVPIGWFGLIASVSEFDCWSFVRLNIRNESKNSAMPRDMIYIITCQGLGNIFSFPFLQFERVSLALVSFSF